MRILLCNERFLFRFGVDRVLLIYGTHLAKRGHTISVMANNLDTDVLGPITDKVIQIPVHGPYIDLNDFTAQWLDTNWDQVFPDDSAPDIAIIGGWPFLAAIPVFKSRGVSVVFSDHGVVPLDNYDGGHRAVLERLISLRREFLPQCDAIAPISDFIADTQSRFDAQNNRLISIVSNGADHMENPVWTVENIAQNVQPGLKNRGLFRSVPTDDKAKAVVLNLGRWEPGCYKNSEAIFDFIDNMRDLDRDCTVLILAEPEKADIPDRYRDSVIPIGFPDDGDLQTVMKNVDLGISVSLWEGFNLPLGEMQWLEKPVLCFDVGAHPEVAIHPWYLCVSEKEMASKACALLDGRGLADHERVSALRDFRARFTWTNTVNQLEALLQALTYTLPQIVVDVSNAAIDPANSGVIRVTRRLCAELQKHCSPIFVIWDKSLGKYVYPTAAECRQLSSFNGPELQSHHTISPDLERISFERADLSASEGQPWLVFTETLMEQDARIIRQFAQENGLKTCAIFYDAIPLLRPDFVKDLRIRDNHAGYMRGLAECDLIIPISEFSAECLRSFWMEEGKRGGAIVTNLLPGEFGGVKRLKFATVHPKDRVNILCVSTLEPRKNHKRLVEAFENLALRRPDIDWAFTMIGNRYAGGDDIAQTVEKAAARNSRIVWKGVVDDRALAEAYASCDFTIYGSEIEGFGMPILESLWNGKPCLCHSAGVMGELAADGGCLTVDMANVEELSLAIEHLATDSNLRKTLSQEATARNLKNWDDYVSDLLMTLIREPEVRMSRSNKATKAEIRGDDRMGWQSLLYDKCLTAEWQMNDSERLSMLAVLSRLQPSCAIEVGTYRGGSLSLISQFVDCVYSIDIDASIPEKYKGISNARFFTGPSDVVLPLLLEKLVNAEIPVEFVLIDGDHSAEGVRRDIEIMLDYKPTKPMIMMMHDGFNPECRKGMIEADWKKSPYVHYVDLDFVPGRVIETGGGIGEMWGGLALAYFSPIARSGEVSVVATSQKTYERALESSAERVKQSA
jgi:glycosyltransferase involved in cell wall biosynthesis